MALSPPSRARIAPEDVSAFDGGETTPPRSYLLAARLFAGGLSGSGLTLLAISSFAVGIGAVSLLPHAGTPRTVQVDASARAKAEPTAVSRARHKPTTQRGETPVRAHARRPRPAQIAQDGTDGPSAGPAEADAVSVVLPTQPAAAPTVSPVASSVQEPAPHADEPGQLPGSDLVDTLVSGIPAPPALPAPTAIPAVPAQASVLTTVTTLVGTP